ncbi:MAG: Maf family protein [Myxococcota bacterium]
MLAAGRRAHEVMTGVALAWSDGRPITSAVVVSRAEMRPASPTEIRAYVALGESLDKAGGYALQARPPAS